MARRFGQKVIYPMHPRTKSKMKGIEIPKGVEVMAPLGFYDFNKLLAAALSILIVAIINDSTIARFA